MDLRNNPLSNALLGKQPAQQPTAGNPLDGLPGGKALHQDPTTGLYFDPESGTTFTDPMGQNVVTDPNVAQQVAANFNASREFLTRFGQVQGNQNKLVGNLQGLLSGQSPSFARSAAAENVNDITQQQRSMAAGVSGPTGPLANLLAMRNAAEGGIRANNAGMMGEIAERTAARNSLASLLGGMGAQDLGAAGMTAGLAANGQQAQQGMNSATNQANQQFNLDYLKGVTGSAAGAIGGAPGG
jgi:hypothetical protein